MLVLNKCVCIFLLATVDFAHKDVLKLGRAGWYVVTKGSADFLSLNLTSHVRVIHKPFS